MNGLVRVWVCETLKSEFLDRCRVNENDFTLIGLLKLEFFVNLLSD